jgi:hypothetical protein
MIHWSTDEDAKLTIYLKTSADATIAKCQIGPFSTAPGSMRFHTQFAGSGGLTDSRFYSDRGLPIVVRFTRDGSNVCGFQIGLGSVPFSLVNALDSSNDTLFAPTSSGTVARVEAEVTTPSGPGTNARFGFKMDWLQSL